MKNNAFTVARWAPKVGRVGLLGAAFLGVSALGCSDPGTELSGVSSFAVTIEKVDGAAPPSIDKPLVANLGTTEASWDFTLQALDAYGVEVDYDGYARVRVEPGALDSLTGEGAANRNILFKGGKAAGTALVTAVYGPSRLWVEDLGYVPAEAGKTPTCADGKDNDEDGVIDYPADPGCAFADDDTEAGGTFAAGVSAPVYYALPRISDVQGHGTKTPYPFEGIQIGTADPQNVIVTRVSSDGFYATDIADKDGYSSIFAFNFNTPSGMRVCDRLVYLAGTVNEFFGFTELSFPTYSVTFIKEGEGECQVPPPAVLDGKTILNDVTMESLESSLVRVEGYHISKKFGPKAAHLNAFQFDTSNCDLDGDGQVDFTNGSAEQGCANACSADEECTEWTAYSARGNYKISKGSSQIQIQTSSVADFDPPSFRGQELKAVTGTMRNFSGGTLNWTIETRCSDDLVCEFSKACSDKIKTSKEACVSLHKTDDPDEGLN
jgi:hypothetical protein